MTDNFRGRLIYNSTNNDFKMHVNGSTTPSLTLNSQSLTVGGNFSASNGTVSCSTLQVSSTSTFTGNISAPNIYTRDEINGLLSGYATTTSVSGLQQITSTTALSLASISCNKVIAPVLESSVATLSLKVSTNTEVLSLSSLLTRLYTPVMIEQGCKVKNGLSIGAYSSVTPSLWVESASFMDDGSFLITL